MANRGGHVYRGTQIARAARQDSKVWRGLQPASVQRVSEVQGEPGNTAGPSAAREAHRPERPGERARRIARLVAGSRRNSLLTAVMRRARAIEDLAWRRQRLARLLEATSPRAMAAQRRLEALAALAVVRAGRR